MPGYLYGRELGRNDGADESCVAGLICLAVDSEDVVHIGAHF